jgi:hypothetical protein
MTDETARARDAERLVIKIGYLLDEEKPFEAAALIVADRLAAEARGRAAVDSVLHDFIRAYDEGVFGDAGWHDREADIVARIRALKDTPR